MACPNCGSWAVKADRSLAGRMVCARCGQLLAGSAQGRRRRGLAWPLTGPQLDRRWRSWIALTLLLAVSALLAARVPEGRHQPSGPGTPPHRQGPLT